ncbi:MAG TPA: Re/Si-specific NAD(P)(+) transhydrogenase subunit alpha [Planctomycetota bacterium]|jgi:NAD(P) transhydrogenase subunit alpha|nr:Re/Si-specific NAD(P)(+) transhydrogenase subunit alpha [Planctomycetota bacterium]
MSKRLGVPKESVPGERRVALVPELVPKLLPAGLEVAVQAGAGTAAGFPDAAFAEKGARVEPEVLERSDVVLKVQPPTVEEVGRLREGAVLIGFLQPYAALAEIRALAERRVTSFAMELMPRLSRAQSMDALSAMGTVAGYKAVLLAAERLPKFFPLLMTAAGTVSPAKVFVVGAGVAGLQAIGTARRLGALVEAYDLRPAVKEQVESLGARFVEVPLETKDAEDKGGYAKGQSEEFLRRQREFLARSVAASDVVITTALVPGQRAPVLITEDMVKGMRPGSVVVDLAAEQGGNCALTEPGKEVERAGVRILGPTNIASTLPFHASQMYARSVVNFLLYVWKEGGLRLDPGDELARGPLLTHGGEVVHEAVKGRLAAPARAS